jgi:hypothetical protein
LARAVVPQVEPPVGGIDGITATAVRDLSMSRFRRRQHAQAGSVGVAVEAEPGGRWVRLEGPIATDEIGGAAPS